MNSCKLLYVLAFLTSFLSASSDKDTVTLDPQQALKVKAFVQKYHVYEPVFAFLQKEHITNCSFTDFVTNNLTQQSNSIVDSLQLIHNFITKHMRNRYIKSLEHAMEHGLSLSDIKNPVFMFVTDYTKFDWMHHLVEIWLLDWSFQTDQHGWYPLQKAAWEDNVGVAKLLVNAGAYINIYDDKEDYKTPLYWAVLGNSLKMTDFLINAGAHINRNFMYIAIENNNAAIVKKLLNSQVNFDQSFNESSRLTPLHCAAFKGCDDIVALFIRKKFNLNHQDDDGATPLSLAVQNRHENVVKLLTAAKADTTCRDYQGKTVFDYSSSEDMDQMIMRNHHNSVTCTIS